MTKSIVHMCLDIRGAMQWPKRRLAGLLSIDGRRATAKETWNYLADQLAMGRKVLPMGTACDGFSYETGCPGHVMSCAEQSR